MTQPISTTSTHSVLQLQQYLNLLSRRYPFITPVRANGQYDQATQQAVMQFQRELHPPVTGVVDQGTWNAIQKAAKAQALPDFTPRSLRAFPPTANVLPDTHHSYMRVPQAMFQALLTGVTYTDNATELDSSMAGVLLGGELPEDTVAYLAANDSAYLRCAVFACKDKDAAAAVKKLIQTYIDDSIDAKYNVDEVALLQNAKIHTMGNYVAVAVTNDSDNVNKIIDQYFA